MGIEALHKSLHMYLSLYLKFVLLDIFGICLFDYSSKGHLEGRESIILIMSSS